MFTPEMIVNYDNTFLKCPFKPKIEEKKEERKNLKFFTLFQVYLWTPLLSILLKW